MNSFSGKPKSLYRELAIAMVVLVTLVSVAVNLLNYLYFAHDSEAIYQGKSEEYAVYLRKALELPLWDIDDELIRQIGSAFAANAEIASLTVRDDTERVVYQQQKPDSNQIKRRIAITHNGQNIGSAEIGLSLSAYNDRNRQLILASIATMVVLIAVLLAATRWILSRLLRKPMDAFIGVTGDMVAGKYRQLELPQTYVEFSSVLSGFKTMSDAVASRESSLRQINEDLAAEIGERKHAEDALRASEERWQFALEGAGDGVWDWDVQTGQTTFSKRWKEMIGFLDDEFENSFAAWKTHIHPDDMASVSAALKDYFDGRSKVYEVEFRMRCKDGSWKWILARGKAVSRDANGQPLRMIGTHADISERKKAEAMRMQLAAIVESSSDAIIGKTPEGIITSWNKGAQRIYGYAANEIIGKPITMLAPPSRHQEIHEFLQRIRQGEDVANYESERVRKDGALIQVALTLSPIRDASGNVSGISTIVRDITEKKRLEEALRQASVYTRSLIEASLDPLVTINAEGKITDVNQATELVTGMDRSELIGTDFSNYFTEPDKAREGYQQVFAKGSITDYPLALRHRDGHVTDVLYNASVYRNEAGNVLGIFAAARDITERKQIEGVLRVNEERLKLATTAGNIGIWDWDVSKNVLTWDKSMYALYGLREENFGGAYEAWISTLHPDDRQFADDEIQAALRGEREYAPEFRIIRPDGTVRNIKASSKTYYDQQGKATRMIGTNFDITGLKQIEEELRRYKDHLEEEVQQRTSELVLARDAAEAANKAKSVFLSSMSHELRTPLNAILGFSNMMRRDPLLAQEQRENLDIINRSGEHLLTLINDVLEMAKIEAGRVQLENAPFDLGALVRDVADMMHVRSQEKGLQLLIDQSSEFPRYIKGDEARLRQVLINLVGNAVKFTRQGGITLRLGVKAHAEPQRLLIEVEDSGIGIKPDDLQRIFEPFVQLGQTAAQAGTGLGLTITRQFVQLMGGALNVESTPGKGSIFQVELPLEKVDAVDVVKPETMGRGEIVGLAPGQPEYRILIVEDQLENQLLLSKLMKNVGFPVKVAGNGKEAVALFDNWRPQLIWMDRRMPVMDGMEATKRIRELPGGKEVKIVAVTASAFMEQRDEMLNAGMDDFVRKPYRFNEIYECLERQLGVKYLYTETKAEEASEVALTAGMLAVLPPTLRLELYDALESLESERINAIIDQVAAHDAKLQKTLSHLADNFDYMAILNALQALQKDAG